MKRYKPKNAILTEKGNKTEKRRAILAVHIELATIF